MKQNSLLPLEIIYLQDGTELRLCKGVVSRSGSRKLYCSEKGRFYSFSVRGLNQIRPFVTKNWHRKPNVHSNYPRLCGYVGNPCCHMLVALAWVGPKPANGYVVDHINGVLADCRAVNLQWVTPAENRKRAVILRARRMIARQDGRPELLPENMAAEELLTLFTQYNVAGDCYEGE